MTESASISIGIDGRGAANGAQIVVRHLDDIRKAAYSAKIDIQSIEKSIIRVNNIKISVPSGFGALSDNIQRIVTQIKLMSVNIADISSDFGRMAKETSRATGETVYLLSETSGAVKSTKTSIKDVKSEIQNLIDEYLQPVLAFANRNIGLLAGVFAVSSIATFLNFARETNQTLWAMGPAIKVVGSAFKSLATVAWANPIVLAIGVIAVAIAGLATYIYQNWDVLKDWGGHFVTLGDVVTSVIEEMSDRVAYWTELFKVDVKLLVAAVRYQFALMGDFFGTVFERMAKWIEAFKNHFQDVTTHIGKIWDALWDGNISKASELSNQTIKFNAPDGSFLEDFKNNLKKSFEDIDIGGILRERADIEAKYAHLDGGFTASLDRRLADKAATRAGDDLLASITPPEDKGVEAARKAAEDSSASLKKIQADVEKQKDLTKDQIKIIKDAGGATPDKSDASVPEMPEDCCGKLIALLTERLPASKTVSTQPGNGHSPERQAVQKVAQEEKERTKQVEATADAYGKQSQQVDQIGKMVEETNEDLIQQTDIGDTILESNQALLEIEKARTAEQKTQLDQLGKLGKGVNKLNKDTQEFADILGPAIADLLKVGIDRSLKLASIPWSYFKSRYRQSVIGLRRWIDSRAIVDKTFAVT